MCAVSKVATGGALEPFDIALGVDHGPVCDVGPGVDLADELRDMGAPLIRTHDSGVLDWPVVYPHPGLDGAFGV